MMGDDFILEEELIADERAGEASWPATTILHQPISGLPGLRGFRLNEFFSATTSRRMSPLLGPPAGTPSFSVPRAG